MAAVDTRLERTAFWALTISLAVAPINLLTAQVAFGVAAILWGIDVARHGRSAVPPFFWALVAYGAWTLLSACFSGDPRSSIIDCKQLVLFLVVPLVARFARGDRALTTLNVVIAVGAFSALIGVIEFTMLGYNDLANRPTGLLSHYMTYSGVIMLILGAAVARLIYYPAERIWPAIAVPALLVALAVTYARNAWIGALASIGALLAIRRLRLLILLPLLVVLFMVAAPAGLRDRAFSIFDRHDPTNRDRIAMLTIGRRIVADHPFFGVGPDRVKAVYTQYRPPEAVNPTNPHLHNVPVQIAAERGLPALALWTIFIVMAALSLVRQLRQDRAPAIAGAGLAAIVAMLAAGLFEYNFGDSEFLMLFLGLITLPFAAIEARNDRAAS